MHTSIVFNIINGAVPPEDILLAGYPLKYPWAHHYLVAILCQITHIPPYIGFFLFNLFALIVSAVIVFKISQLLHPTQQTGIFAVFFSFFGTSFFFILSFLNFGALIHSRDLSALPLHKFASANSNSIGFCLFFICFFFLIRLFSYQGKSYINGIAIASSITAIAFLYPICWFATSVVCITVCLGQAITHRKQHWQAILIVSIALLFGTMIAMPYLHHISAGKPPTSEFSFNFRLRELCRRGFVLLITLSLPLFILWLKRGKVKALFKSQTSEILTVGFASIGTAFLYIFVTVPLDCQYKFLMLTMAIFGIAISPFFSSLYQERFILAKPIITLLFLPTIWMFFGIFTQVQFADLVHADGMNIKHNDTYMDELYSYISTKTPMDTIVIDSFLSVPVLGRRSLYVATDLRREQDSSLTIFDGWLMSAKTMSMEVFGQDQGIVQRRLQNATDLLTSNQKDIVNAAADRVKQEFNRRQVIVIVRNQSANNLFEKNPHFSLEFDSSVLRIYTIK